jgi:hypothetical protein
LAGDFVEGFDPDRWHDLHLWCERAPLTDATSGLITEVALGQRRGSLEAACRRIVTAAP